MARIVVTAVVARIEIPATARLSVTQEVVLCDATDGDGLPLPDGLRINLTGAMRGIGLQPGDRIAMVANLDAYNRGRRLIGADIEDVVAFLRALPNEDRNGVTFRLRHPANIRASTPRGVQPGGLGPSLRVPWKGSPCACRPSGRTGEPRRPTYRRRRARSPST
jgi:hypothetical protein